MPSFRSVLRRGLLAAALAVPAAAAPPELRLIGVAALPAAAVFAGTPVGGLSGLDYDAAADRWVAISDDRAEHGPARVYTVKLDYGADGVRGAEIVGVTELRQPDGSAYAGRGARPARGGEVPDCEAVRLDPRDGALWYASEGDRALGCDPFVRRASRDGAWTATLPLPEAWRFRADGTAGPRPNLALESLAFAPDGASLWTATEAPLFADGPVATRTEGGVVRLTRLARDGRVLAQQAYHLDPWQLEPAAGLRADNGLAELLAWPDGRLLALERSGAERAPDTWRFAARLYLADLAGATDVADRPALAVRPGVKPAAKRLLYDFAPPGDSPGDNLEGLAWGRRLPDGRATLVVVSDNNFSPATETRFWIFAVSFPP